MKYLIVHILDVESNDASSIDALYPEIEPRAIIVFRVIGADPDIVLNKTRTTAIEEAFSTKERLPESNSELNLTGPS